MQHSLQPQHPDAQQHFSAASVAAAAAVSASNPPYMNGRVKSETGSDRGGSPHSADGSRYPGAPHPGPVPAYTQMGNYPTDMRYPSPTAAGLGVPTPMMNGYSNPQDPSGYGQRGLPDPGTPQGAPTGQTQGGANIRMAPDNGPPKAFACSTCGKGFARRSDLARHGL
jgi:hypothetical protein